MKWRIIHIIISITAYLLLSSSSCRQDTQDCHQNIFVDNKSTKDIYILPSWDYPDTTIYHQNVSPKTAGQLKIIAGTNNSTYLPRRCWEVDFTDKRIGKDTLIIYLLDAQIIETMSWDSVKSQNLYLKRFDLSLADLQAVNWQLTFKP